MWWSPKKKKAASFFNHKESKDLPNAPRTYSANFLKKSNVDCMYMWRLYVDIIGLPRYCDRSMGKE